MLTGLCISLARPVSARDDRDGPRRLVDRDRYARVKQVFVAALDVEPERRGEFVASECAGDEALRLAIEEMLEQVTSSTTWHGEVRLPPPLAPGTVVAGRYRVDAELGAGGMGRVYRATQIALGREVALKVLAAGASASAAALARFEREASSVARLRHPNIVTVHDAGAEPGVGADLVMELVPGRSPADEGARADGSPRRGRRARATDRGGRRAAHAAGIVHRDLKPENMMLERVGRPRRVKVLDFGIAKVDRRPRRAGHARREKLGRRPERRPHCDWRDLRHTLYMSGEQARGTSVDARTDVWSLGVPSSTNCCPARRPSAARPARRRLPRSSATIHPRSRGVPEALERLVGRALAKDPDRRVGSARELAVKLVRAGGPGRVRDGPPIRSRPSCASA